MTDFLQVGELVDLTNCEREPIHIPGLIQPRGVLLVLAEPGLAVVQASENVATTLDVRDPVGRPLGDVVGAAAASEIAQHVQTFGDLRERNPLSLSIGAVVMDAVLHRVSFANGSVLVVELEPADGPRPFSFPNTYQAVRGAVGALNRAATLTELYATAADEIRSLTGFDRVMIYRFDEDYNGEVVAEAKRDDLNPFLGLHYPSTDIPAQARTLYEKNWIRLISDVEYTPSPILPSANPLSGGPLDLTHATLRSVSPIHVEYLRNMGVRASMSISLLRDDRLWGLVACHQYSGPHTPPYGVRAAAEFLGSALSLRLVNRAEEEDQRAVLLARSTLAGLVAAMQDDNVPLAAALLGRPGLLDLVPADGVLVRTEGRVSTDGVVLQDAVLDEVLAKVGAPGAEITLTENLSDAVSLPPDADPGVAGVLALTLPDDQVVVWFRREVVRHVDWGGDPGNKAIAVREGDTVRLSPRLSFDRWQQVVRGRSNPWRSDQVESARALRGHLIEALYQRGRRRTAAAETVQRSLLPTELPQPAGWQLDARYQPSAGGHVGGDWYDALTLPDGRLAIVVGDVAGHGLEAAGAMSQLRNSLRAYLLIGQGPAEALAALDQLVGWVLPGQMATLVVALIDTSDGSVELASAGHLPPCLLHEDGRVDELAVNGGLPLGVTSDKLPTTTLTLGPGDGLVLFTDGVIERRTESLDAGISRLQSCFTGVDPMGAMDAALNSRDPLSTDDATLLVLRRDVS